VSVPHVSIVIPFLNEERFLREAIESVFAQTHDAWELVLVDDGSSDQSTEIALECASRFRDRVCYVTHADGQTHGLPASRNRGIAHAKHDYLAFLDADDVWLPQKLEQQTELLSAHPEVGMLYGLSQWWYSWSGLSDDLGRDFVHKLGIPAGVVMRAPSLLRPFFVAQEAAIPNPTNILVRRSLIELVGGFEESFPHVYEDQAFYAKVCVHASVLAADSCWDRYRQRPGSRTGRVVREREKDAARVRFLTWLIAYISKHGVDDEICAALSRQRKRYANRRLVRIRRIRLRA
jgi:glycosyltransferase involved in cell wall biosynthesis